MDERVARAVLDAYPGRKMSVRDARRVIRAWASQWPEDRWGNFKPTDTRRIKLTKRQVRREEKRGGTWRVIRSTPMVEAALNLVQKAAEELGEEKAVAKVERAKATRTKATRKREERTRAERLHKEVMDMVAKVASAEMPVEFVRVHDEGGASEEFQTRFNELVKRIQTLRRLGNPPRDQEMFSTFSPPVAPLVMDVSAEWVEEMRGEPYTVTIRHAKDNVAVIEIGATAGIGTRVDPMSRWVSESLMGFDRQGDAYISGRLHRSEDGPYAALYFIASKEKQRGAGGRVLDLWCNLMDSYGVKAWVAEAVGDEGVAFLDAKVRAGRLEKIGGRGSDIVMRCLGGPEGRQPPLPGLSLKPNPEEGRYRWAVDESLRQWRQEAARAFQPEPALPPASEPNPLYWLWKKYGSGEERRAYFMESTMARHYATAAYAWAVPTEEIVRDIAAWGPILEIGAGKGYWAKMIADAGGDIIATDPYTPDDTETFYPVESLSDVDAVRKYGTGRTLLMVWPPYDMPVAFNALREFESVRGTRVIYVGEGSGGCTGDDNFHEAIGLGGFFYDEDAPRVKNIGWSSRRYEADLPRWYGIYDDVFYFERPVPVVHNPDDIDSEQLAVGTKHEMEHTDDPDIARQIAIDHLREMPDYYTRLEKMERRYKAGMPPNPADVIGFPDRPRRITIGSRTYAVSDVGVPIVSEFALGEEAEGARVIEGGGERFRYIWVYEPNSDRLEMYRHSDGEWKVLGKPSDYPQTMDMLVKRGHLNEVSPEEMVEFEVEMRRRNDETLQHLKEWAEEIASDEQRQVDTLVRRYFDERVVPDVQRRFADIDRGVVPFGFKYEERIPKTREHQAKAHAVAKILGREGFHSPYGSPLEGFVLAELGKSSIDDLDDPQAIQWAASDVAYDAYDKLLPK